MRILVAGATGSIGIHVVNTAIAMGHQPVTLVRVSSNAAVAFLGTTVTSNVGIQILDSTGEVLVLDGATFSAKTDLIDGTNILPFQARYIALGQSVAGTANADATFKVQYL